MEKLVKTMIRVSILYKFPINMYVCLFCTFYPVNALKRNWIKKIINANPIFVMIKMKTALISLDVIGRASHSPFLLSHFCLRIFLACLPIESCDRQNPLSIIRVVCCCIFHINRSGTYCLLIKKYREPNEPGRKINLN